MNNFNYSKITKSKKIRYLKISKKKGTYIVFLHGFMSDLEGKKPRSFLNFSKKNNLGFLALEYSGHGKSSGKFTDGNISKWSKETSYLIKKIVKKNDNLDNENGKKTAHENDKKALFYVYDKVIGPTKTVKKRCTKTIKKSSPRKMKTVKNGLRKR